MFENFFAIYKFYCLEYYDTPSHSLARSWEIKNILFYLFFFFDTEGLLGNITRLHNFFFFN